MSDELSVRDNISLSNTSSVNIYWNLVEFSNRAFAANGRILVPAGNLINLTNFTINSKACN